MVLVGVFGYLLWLGVRLGIIDMNINTLFRISTCNSYNRQQVFDTLVTLAKTNKNLLLVYREGRRTDDDFIKKPLKIDNLLFERIQFSNEWQIFIDFPNTSQARLAFMFSDNQLFSVTAINGEIFLVIPFTFMMRCWLNKVSIRIDCAIPKWLPLADKNNSDNHVSRVRSQKKIVHNKRFEDV